MEFSFVDRILELEPGVRALGLKHVTPHDEFLRQGENGEPALLSCIVGEALGQLGAWCVMAANDFRRRPVAGVVGEVGLLAEAMLGDTVLLDTRIDSLTEEAVVYHAVATVRGRTIATLTDSLGPFLPMEEFSDPDQMRAQFGWIHRPGRPSDLPEGMPIRDVDIPTVCRHTTFDRILSHDSGKSIAAVKSIPILAPFLADHFARKPVFPMSLLLESQLQLARRLLGPTSRPTRIRNVKMNDFVLPGSSVVATATVKDRTADRAWVALRGEVDGRRVSLAEAEFVHEAPPA